MTKRKKTKLELKRRPLRALNETAVEQARGGMMNSDGALGDSLDDPPPPPPPPSGGTCSIKITTRYPPVGQG